MGIGKVLGKVFGKVASGVGIGAKGVWKGVNALDDVVDRIPGGQELVAQIPVVGIALQIGLRAVDVADELVPEKGAGAKRKERAIAQARKMLVNQGLEPDQADELVSIAFLLKRNMAGIAQNDGSGPVPVGTLGQEADGDEKAVNAGEDEASVAAAPQEAPETPKAAKKGSQGRSARRGAGDAQETGQAAT